MHTIEEIQASAGRARRAVTAAGLAFGALGIVNLVDALRDGSAAWSGWFLLVLALSVFVALVAGVMWLQWFGLVHETAERYGVVREQGWWRLWGWLVPVGNLVVPKRMVNDIWWTRDRGVRTALPWQVQVWWACWVAAGVLALVVRPMEGRAEDVFDAVGELLIAWSTPFAVGTIRLLTLRVTQPRAAAAAEALAG